MESKSLFGITGLESAYETVGKSFADVLDTQAGHYDDTFQS